MTLVGCAPRTSVERIPASTLLAEPVPTSLPSAPTALAAPAHTPTPRPTRQPPAELSRTYTVQNGDTMTAIALGFQTTVEELMEFNGLYDPNQLYVGQILNIPMKTTVVGPEAVLIPDSELVYGPAYANFDVARETARYDGWFNSYSEYRPLTGETLSGPELVTLVAQQYSVGPRILLTLLEMESGWLTDPDPSPQGRLYPLGNARDGWDGLAIQLMWAADKLNEGFYGWLHEEFWTVRLADGTYVQFAPTLNSGTAALQRFFALHTDEAGLQARLRTFEETYRQLWGEPFAYAIEPLLPQGAAPTLALPWAKGETWYYTGGPHGGWGDGSAWAALDFVSGERNLGCRRSELWTRAAAPGTILYSHDGMVLQDLDGDGFEGSGWVLLYMHMAAEGRVSVGAQIETGDPIGHPSCEGGFSTASHLHFARRYNGVWIAAEHPEWPLTLGGWTAHNGDRPYRGTLVREGVVKTAKEDWTPGNALTH